MNQCQECQPLDIRHTIKRLTKTKQNLTQENATEAANAFDFYRNYIKISIFNKSIIYTNFCSSISMSLSTVSSFTSTLLLKSLSKSSVI